LDTTDSKKRRIPIPKPNKVVQALLPYDPANTRDATINGIGKRPLKLDWNESTRPPAPGVIKAVKEVLDKNHMNLYPDIEVKELRHALSGYTGLSKEHILVTNGSDSSLELIVRTFFDPGEVVGIPVPTYSHFIVFAKGTGLKIREIPYENPFQVDWKALEQALHEGVSMLYLPSPSNPTGIVYHSELVRGMAEEFPNVIFLLDEAYFEFSGQTCAKLVDEYPNIIVTRTFSKAFGMAGFRVGYLLAHPKVVEHLSKIHNPKSVATLNQAAATAALQDVKYMRDYVVKVRAAREWTVSQLRKLGIEAMTTHANYLLFRVENPKAFDSALHAQNCFVRDRSSMPGMAGWIRVTVGPKDDMAEFVNRVAHVRAGKFKAGHTRTPAYTNKPDII